MTDETNERLRALGAKPAPPIDEGFADRLESRLRVQHAEMAPSRQPRLPRLLPRLAVALVVVIAGLAGSAALTARDAGVPVSVVPGDPIAPADEPVIPDQDGPAIVVEPTQTPTAVETDSAETDSAETEQALATTTDPTTAPDVATPGSTVESPATVVPAPPVEATSTAVAVSPSAEPTSTAVPPQPDPAATPTVVPTATPEPRPTATAAIVPATAVPVAPAPRPSPTATSTAIPEPLPLALSCAARQSGDAVGVVCEWDAVEADPLTHYQVFRSRNGGDREVVSRQRATAPTMYVDRDIEPGDEAIYLVRGLGIGDVVIAASVREVVNVP